EGAGPRGSGSDQPQPGLWLCTRQGSRDSAGGGLRQAEEPRPCRQDATGETPMNAPPRGSITIRWGRHSRLPKPGQTGMSAPPDRGLNATLSLLLCLLLTLPAAGGSKVTFRDDHTLLVDGKPFFPIGLYYCTEEFEDKSDRLLKELKDYGFNTLGYYRWGVDGWKSELDRAHQQGLKVWIRGHNGFSIDSPEIEKAALDQVRQTRTHPVLLFWEFQDEPILNKVSIEGSRKGYRLVKREDPDHPLLVVEWPGAVEQMHLWKGIGDLFATDLYPIPRSR